MKRRTSKEPSEAQKAARARNFDIMRLEGMIANARQVRAASHISSVCRAEIDKAVKSLNVVVSDLRNQTKGYKHDN